MEKSKENQNNFFEAQNAWKQKSKNKYYINLVLENGGDTKQLFRTVNKIMHRTSDNPMPEYESAQQLANEFRDFFYFN